MTQKLKFTVTEKQDFASRREGTAIEAVNLSAAKRKASQMQFFQGTVLEISTTSGIVLSRKTCGKWKDSPDVFNVA